VRTLDDCASYMAYVGEERPRRPSSRDYANRGVADRCKFYPVALTKPVISSAEPFRRTASITGAIIPIDGGWTAQ